MSQDNTTTEETSPTDKTTTEELEGKSTSDSATFDKRTEDALKVYDILEDPVRNRAFVEDLARQAGLLTPPETKQEAKVAKKSARDFVKSHLGDEYKFIAEKLGSAIDEYFEDRLGEVNGKFAELAKSHSERSFSTEFDTFISAQEVTEEEAGQILKQLEVMSPNPNVPLKKFLGEQLELVRFRSGKQANQQQRTKRSVENFSRRAESTGSDSGERVIQQPKNVSIRDAVQAAIRGEKWS